MNWKAEAKEKLRRYDAMRLATINIPQEIQRLEVDAQRIRAAKTDTSVVKSSGGSREDAMLDNILHRQELTWTLQQAQFWLQTTERAMSALTPQEKMILHRLYIYPESGAIERLCKDLGLESSSIYRRRDKALQHFALAYYGVADI